MNRRKALSLSAFLPAIPVMAIAATKDPVPSDRSLLAQFEAGITEGFKKATAHPGYHRIGGPDSDMIFYHRHSFEELHAANLALDAKLKVSDLGRARQGFWFNVDIG
jgi:hypothetical protein